MCTEAEVNIQRRQHPCSTLPPAMLCFPDSSSPESLSSVNYMHWNPHLRLCFQENWPKASYTFSIFSHTEFLIPLPEYWSPHLGVHICFFWEVGPGQKYLSFCSWVMLAACCHSAPILSPARYLPLGLVTDGRAQLAGRDSSIHLQYGSVRLGSSSGASWERCAWAPSLVLRVQRKYSHVIYCDACFASCILLRHHTLQIKIICLKGVCREMFLKGTMFSLCLLPPSTGPLTIYWMKGWDNGDSELN